MNGVTVVGVQCFLQRGVAFYIDPFGTPTWLRRFYGGSCDVYGLGVTLFNNQSHNSLKLN